MAPIVYNIPTHLVGEYRGQRIIVRAADPQDLVCTLDEGYLDDVVGVQIHSMTTDGEPLSTWGYSIPVELVMTNPEVEFALLYQFAKLLDKHPMWVSIPATEGMIKAVKLAASLRFGIRLEVGQPSVSATVELSKVLEFFLHNKLVSQPIQFFQGLLVTEFNDGAETLWQIQDEDPAMIRYVTDDGVECIARQPRNEYLAGDLGTFVEDFSTGLIDAGAECQSCEFLKNCAGYFKWPLTEYSCDGVKVVLRSIQRAARDLKNDVAAQHQEGVGA